MVGCQNTVLMPGAGSGILKTWKPAGAQTAACAPPWTCTTEDRRRPGGSRPGRRCRLRARAGRTHRGSPPGTALPAGRVRPARAAAAARGPGRSERGGGPADGRRLRRPGPRRPARPGCACARQGRHPGDRGGQVQVPHRDPRGASPARILGTPAVRHCRRDARSRRGGPGPAHGRPVPAARRTAPRRHPRADRSARSHHDRPPADRQRQPAGLQAAIFAKITAACGAGPDHVAVDYGHGRIVKRSIWVTSADGIEFPHAAQVLRIRRDTYGLDGTALAREIVHGITTLDAGRGTPAVLAGLTQGQRGIESVHWHRIRRRRQYRICRQRTPGHGRPQKPGDQPAPSGRDYPDHPYPAVHLPGPDPRAESPPAMRCGSQATLPIPWGESGPVIPPVRRPVMRVASRSRPRRRSGPRWPDNGASCPGSGCGSDRCC